MSLPRPLAAFALLLPALLAAAPTVSIPRLPHPGSGQLFYFVLTDRFANGDPANDRGGLTGDRDTHGFDPAAISHFHGGDLAGLTARLDYLAGLGVTAIWLTPPFKNKAVQAGSAGYHGYWITDFEQIDPHLGTNDDFHAFVAAAHARGLRVYLDIIVNHTADVIAPAGGDSAYRDIAGWPYRDASGQPFDARAVAFNGLDEPRFPPLNPARSFAYQPVVSVGEAQVKRPAWLNDVTLYHNRGDSRFLAEDSLDGDFVGLDDLFTEHPAVVRGFIGIYQRWVDAGVDGFRIDTAKHVNPEFWQAFAPAIREHARSRGRPDFFAFGEVYSAAGDARFLSEFSTAATLDAAIDFGFFVAARDYVSRRGSGAALAQFFARDDYYTDHDSTADAMPTFLGNHDAGRFAYFVRQDNPSASDEEVLDRVALGHGLLLLARGQPVVYYGDEQGLVGIGHDMGARESMFPAQAPEFRDLKLLGTSRRGHDDKFDSRHPLYRLISRLTALRREHVALRAGTMHPRTSDSPFVFGFSRVHRDDLLEYVVALNSSARETATATVSTSQPAGAGFTLLFASDPERADETAPVRTDAAGRLPVTLAPLQFAVWRANRALGAAKAEPRLRILTPHDGERLEFRPQEPKDGQVFSSRREFHGAVDGGDGVGEVTFTLVRDARPDQAEWLGTDDAPPYRIFWRPPSDLAPDEPFTLVAHFDDLRGHHATARVPGLTAVSLEIDAGIRGSTGPRITRQPDPAQTVAPGQPLTLAIEATGTAPLAYQWFHDGRPLPDATGARHVIAPAGAAAGGRYFVLVRNLAGTVASRVFTVERASRP